MSNFITDVATSFVRMQRKQHASESSLTRARSSSPRNSVCSTEASTLHATDDSSICSQDSFQVYLRWQLGLQSAARLGKGLAAEERWQRHMSASSTDVDAVCSAAPAPNTSRTISLTDNPAAQQAEETDAGDHAVSNAAAPGMAQSPHMERVHALLLRTEHWLEVRDPRHRYGSNLRPYFEHWLACESSSGCDADHNTVSTSNHAQRHSQMASQEDAQPAAQPLLLPPLFQQQHVPQQRQQQEEKEQQQDQQQCMEQGLLPDAAEQADHGQTQQQTQQQTQPQPPQTDQQQQQHNSHSCDGFESHKVGSETELARGEDVLDPSTLQVTCSKTTRPTHPFPDLEAADVTQVGITARITKQATSPTSVSCNCDPPQASMGRAHKSCTELPSLPEPIEEEICPSPQMFAVVAALQQQNQAQAQQAQRQATQRRQHSALGPRENFFQWLDYGAGSTLDLAPTGGPSRHKLDSQIVTYLTSAQLAQYEVVVDPATGQLVYKLSRKPLHTDAPNPADTAEAQAGCDNESQPTDKHPSADAPAPGKQPARAIRQCSSKAEKWIYVADVSGRLFVHPKVRGTFHHSSFLRGAAVLAAGALVVRDGKLVALTADSGHYHPQPHHFRWLFRHLQAQGADLSALEGLQFRTKH